jgi:hypothetical protein
MLKTLKNFTDDPEPDEEDEYAPDRSNTIWFIERHIAGANAVRKVLKGSGLTAIAKTEIDTQHGEGHRDKHYNGVMLLPCDRAGA